MFGTSDKRLQRAGKLLNTQEELVVRQAPQISHHLGCPKAAKVRLIMKKNEAYA
jgi:hypothetical protein